MQNQPETERQRALAARQPMPVAPNFFYLDELGAGKRLGFTDRSGRPSGRRLKDLRVTGGGPRYIRIGNAIRYRSDWLDQWAEANAVTSTSEEAARRRA
jgi:hypothetical protein